MQDLPDLLNFCLSNENRWICEDDKFWKTKLLKDFGITSTSDNPQQEYYIAYFNDLYVNIIIY